MKNKFGLSFFILFLLFQSKIIFAQAYKISEKTSRFEFNTKFKDKPKIKVKINNISGSVKFNPIKLKESNFSLTINTNSISCGIHDIDILLKTGSYFDIKNQTSIKIKSNSISKDLPTGSVYKMNANINLKGISKQIDILIVATNLNNGYLMRGSFALKRSDFKIGFNGEMDDMITFFMEFKLEKI